MYHAACKVEFQLFKRSYSQLTFPTFYLKKRFKNVSCENDRLKVETQLCQTEAPVPTLTQQPPAPAAATTTTATAADQAVSAAAASALAGNSRPLAA